MQKKTKKEGRRLDSYGNTTIFEGFPFNTYNVSGKKLSGSEADIAETLSKFILRKAYLGDLERFIGKDRALTDEVKQSIVKYVDNNQMLQKFPDSERVLELKANLIGVAKKIGVSKPVEFAQYVIDNTVGFNSISELMRDPDLEEIMVNGWNKKIFVFHKQYGICETNIVAGQGGFLQNLLERIAATANRQFNEQKPLLDARLPDGSRVNATTDYVTPAGPSLTIRKFSKMPISIINMICKNTLTSEVAAFLWTMTEGLNISPRNILITGGAGSGKTTLLNVLGFFIRKHDRILSIEDTLELNLGERQNWVQMEARPKFRDTEAVTMDELLRNSLRMRPDRIIVGEVRGEEAQTLFVAMDTGHEGILGTLHSNSARELLLRLKSPPMSVPDQMLPLLDFVVVMQRTYDKSEGIMRRIKHIAEISRMDDKVLLSNVFEYNAKKDTIEKTDVPSHGFERLAELAGLSKRELKREIVVRQHILDWLQEEGIDSNEEVERIIQQYYYDPESVLKQVSENL
ncbi:MAG: CpaF family protein [Candidatus Diapherotrites archaeon]|nr:CpaF family protein [Candidatus Diapherotrites archaeon]